MATSARIGKLLPSGMILSTRIHWDGNRALDILQRQYNSECMVDALLAMGDMCALGDTIETSEFYARDRGETLYASRALKFVSESALHRSNYSEHYMYLFTPNADPQNRWKRIQD